MPSLSERFLLVLVRVELDDKDDMEDAEFMAIVVALALVGITVFSCRSEDSSDTMDTDPVEEAADELESAALHDDDSRVELINGRPISWKEFIELNPLSSSAELEIIISLIRSMFAL